jgi:hypothetical protein
MPYRSHYFFNWKLEARPVLLVEVCVDLLRDVIELLRPPIEDRIGRLVTKEGVRKNRQRLDDSRLMIAPVERQTVPGRCCS